MDVYTAELRTDPHGYETPLDVCTASTLELAQRACAIDAAGPRNFLDPPARPANLIWENGDPHMGDPPFFAHHPEDRGTYAIWKIRVIES